MTAFVRRHAAPLALLAALAAAVAAPYLIPEDPDSAVFRSGALGALLLLAAFFPVRDALRRADRRTLRCGLFWGLLFACALSLGSELFVYDGLLPGLGSAVRRAAVPLLAAPLFGGLAARAMLASPAARNTRRIPAWAFAAFIFACWLPVWLAYFPAMLNYDFPGQYAQHATGEYSLLHPLLHSALCNAVVALGAALQSPSFGLFLMAALQSVLFALSLGCACAFCQRRGAPPAALALIALLFALHPVFSVMAFSMTKDTLFAAAVLMLSLESFELTQDAPAFFASRARCARFALLAACAALLRNNGVFALAFLLPALVLALRGFRRRMLALSALSAAASLVLFGALSLALHPEPMQSFQLYSLPAQQLVRAYNLGDMPDADRAELESWYVYDSGLFLTPHLADRAKGHLRADRLASESGALLDLWARTGRNNPRVYAEAFLMLNVGLWYPDDRSHAEIYVNTFYEDKGYLQTQEYDMSEYGLNTRCLLPAVRALYERICCRNRYQRFPLVSLLFSTATPFWALLFAAARLAARGDRRLVAALFGALGIWLSYLLGPCTLARYVLPLFCLAPPMLAAAFFQPEKEARA